MQGVLRSGTFTAELVPAPLADDAELVLQAQANPHAFELLYRRYVDAVHRYCYRRLGSREAAEDATSLVFTKAFGALPGLRRGSFRSWLFTIAYHVIADDLRARRRRTHSKRSDRTSTPTPSHPISKSPIFVSR